MQDVFSQDMFNLGGISSSRCNGHIPVSSAGKVPTPKRDRKGCKKGKIEAIMRNNLVTSKARVRLQTSPVVKKIKAVQPPVSNHIIKPGTVIKSEYIDSDDPYTFTETEPQVVSLYPSSNNLTLSRKLVPLVSNRTNQVVANKSVTNMVCVERSPDINKTNKSLVDRLNSTTVNHTLELPSRPFLTKVNKVVHNVEGSKQQTMNKLQADIARNKIMGKRSKKMVVNSQSSLSVNAGWESKEIKVEPSDNGLSHTPVFAKVSVPAKRMPRHTTWQREKKSRHEALQRIQENQEKIWNLNRDIYPLGLEQSDSESEAEAEEEDNYRGVYQRHWFMGCVWGNVSGEGSRDSRLAQVSTELRRRVRQMWRGLERHKQDPLPDLVTSVADASRTNPVSTALLLNPRLKFPARQSRAKVSMLVPQKCSLDCDQMALPCTRHCAQHIMYNVNQLLYQHCTAKFTDNTQCCQPVFDITHHHPLCQKHGTAFDNAMRAHNNSKPKKCSRKKSKPAALTRSSKRSKKKKKPRPNESSISMLEVEIPEVEIKTEPLFVTEEDNQMNLEEMNRVEQHGHMMMSSHHDHNSEVFLSDSAPIPQQVEIQVQLEDAVEVVSDEVLAIASLDPTELANQASRLLEEHDITSMLNQIPPDAFTDIFLEDKNGEFGPTVEQTEGLERALEEVDKEVRSLERMTRALPLTSLPLDPMNLLEDVGGYVTYPNGFAAGVAQSVSAQPDLRHS